VEKETTTTPTRTWAEQRDAMYALLKETREWNQRQQALSDAMKLMGV